MRITDWVKHSQQYLFWRQESAKAETRKNAARDWVKEYISINGEPDENGTKRLYFEQSLAIGEDKFAGLELRKSQPKDHIDVEKAKAFVNEHNLNHRVVRMVPTYDWDELIILNQQGLISDEDLDALFVTPDPTYSLYTIEE